MVKTCCNNKTGYEWAGPVDRIQRTEKWPSGFLYFWSYFIFFGPLVFVYSVFQLQSNDPVSLRPVSTTRLVKTCFKTAVRCCQKLALVIFQLDKIECLKLSSSFGFYLIWACKSCLLQNSSLNRFFNLILHSWIYNSFEHKVLRSQ